MPDQTYKITAPNGKVLKITGDHEPSEAELHQIFAEAGVETGATPAGAPADAKPSAISRFFTNAYDQLPIPSGDTIRNAVADPVGSAASFGEGLLRTAVRPISESVHAIGSAAEGVKALAHGDIPNAKGAAGDTIKHLVSAIPLVGPSADQAGEQIGNGDVAGGVGRGLSLILQLLAARGKSAPKANPNDVPLYKQMESVPTRADGAPLPANPRGPAAPNMPAAPPTSDLDLLAAEVKAGRLPQQTLDLAKRRAAEQAVKARAATQAPTGAPQPTQTPVVAPTGNPMPSGGITDTPATPPVGSGVQSVAALAQQMRRLYGSEKAGAMMNPADPAAGAATIERLAPGPSRTPLEAEGRFLDSGYRRLIDDPKGQISPQLVGTLGKHFSTHALAQLIAHTLGLPWSAGAVGAGAANYMIEHPEHVVPAANGAARAAVGANLATRTDQGQTRKALYDLLREQGLLP